MSVYKIEGKRTNGYLDLYVNGKKLSLAKSLKVVNHSPTGFNAGYGGSGPAQSALAICLEIMDRKTAENSYQDFKWDYLAKSEYFDHDFEFEYVS